MNNQPFFETLTTIQSNIDLKEGVHGLIKVLAVFARFKDQSIKTISQESNFPIPICVAIRNELEKVKWVQKTKKGATLTKTGEQVLKSLGGLNEDFSCSKCKELGVSFPYQYYERSLAIMRKYCKMRGSPKTQIDQSFATPKTNLARVLFMSHKYDLFRKNFAFIGDSDLTSIALALYAHKDSKIVVFDIDSKIKSIIELANKELGKNIQFVEHDFRKPISNDYSGIFDCIVTDPPYTISGCSLFVSRGLDLLSKNKIGVIYLSFSKKPPIELLKIEKNLLEMGCLITDIKPRFNQYIGAQKLGGVSTLYRLEAIPPITPQITGVFEEAIYTGDITPKIRVYQCTKCSETIEIGKGRDFITIEQLKEEGCQNCNNQKFHKLSEKKIE